MSEEDWKRMEEMSYKDAMKFLEDHSVKTTGFKIFTQYFTSLEMFLFYIKNVAKLFIFNLIIALIIAFRILGIKRIEINRNT